MKKIKVHKLRIGDRILVYKSIEENRTFDDIGYRKDKSGNFTKEVWASVTDKEYQKTIDSSYWYIQINHHWDIEYKPGSVLDVKPLQ